MARKPDIQYIQYRTEGTAARQLQLMPRTIIKQTLPKAPRRKQRVIHVDPLALGGILVSAVMLVLMLVGMAELFTLREQTQQMESYVSQLHSDNYHLKAEYEAGYELEEIKKTAHVLGLVPVEEKTVTVSMTADNVTMRQPTVWERMSAFIEQLFA